MLCPDRDACYFLGMEILRDRGQKTIQLSQRKFATELLNKSGMTESKGTSTPSLAGLRLSKVGTHLDTSMHPFREVVGGLLYLAVCTRPDIAQAVGVVARYFNAPTGVHWTALRHILRYIKGTVDMGIIYSASEPGMTGYSDADYAGDIDTRRSTTGYAFMMNGGAVSWSSRLQDTVVASTDEPEYMAAAAAVKEALWIRKLLPEMDIETAVITIMVCFHC